MLLANTLTTSCIILIIIYEQLTASQIVDEVLLVVASDLLLLLLLLRLWRLIQIVQVLIQTCRNSRPKLHRPICQPSLRSLGTRVDVHVTSVRLMGRRSIRTFFVWSVCSTGFAAILVVSSGRRKQRRSNLLLVGTIESSGGRQDVVQVEDRVRLVVLKLGT